MKSTIILVLVLVSFVGFSTAAVSCYECTYWEGSKSSDENCKNSPPDSQYSVNCKTEPESTSYCRKIETKIDGMDVVYRSCYNPKKSVDLADQCPKLEEDFYIPQHGFVPADTLDCYCTRDKCNTAVTISSGNLSLFIGLAIIIKVFKLF